MPNELQRWKVVKGRKEESLVVALEGYIDHMKNVKRINFTQGRALQWHGDNEFIVLVKAG
jgi:hypothetical protein